MSNPAASQVLLVGPVASRPEIHAHLRRQGYEVLTAVLPKEADAILARRKIACVLADGSPDARGGLAFVAELLRNDQDLPVVLIAERPDLGIAVQSIRLGAMDYLPGNAGPEAVSDSVARAVEERVALVHTRTIVQALGEQVGTLTAELRRERKHRDDVALAAMESLVCVVEAKDLWLAGHSVRVAQMAASLAAELGRSDAEVEEVRLAGRLHDIGMVGVGEGILSKQGPLTPEEFERVRAHVTLGSQILAPLPGLGPVVSFVRHHHERWDGQGYPDRLAGDEVPWGARVIGVAEIYDAMTTARPYREPMTPDLAVQHMKTLVGAGIGETEWRGLASVVGRNEALVFVVDAHAESSVGAMAASLHL